MEVENKRRSLPGRPIDHISLGHIISETFLVLFPVPGTVSVQGELFEQFSLVSVKPHATATAG